MQDRSKLVDGEWYNTDKGVKYFSDGLFLTPQANDFWEPDDDAAVTVYAQILAMDTDKLENSYSGVVYTTAQVDAYCTSASRRGKKQGLSQGYEDMMVRFNEDTKHKVANLMAHEWTISAIEMQSKYMGEPIRYCVVNQNEKSKG